MLTGTAFEKTRQSPTTPVLLLRGITKGESTERLARELGLWCKLVHTLRQHVQTRVNETASTGLMEGTTFEADEHYQNAGKKVRRIVTQVIRRDDVPMRRAGAAPMPLIGHQSFIWSRARAASIASPRGYPVCDHADKRTCHELIEENIPLDSTVLYTDEANS